MKIIDASYYSMAPWVIANAVANPKSAMEVAASKVIGELIEHHQNPFLVKVLGEGASAVIEELDSKDSPDSLIGEVKAIVESLREPFGAYVYFHILRHAHSINGITGVYQLVSSDKSLSPRHMQVQAWNSMVCALRALSCEKGWKIDCNLITPVNEFNI